MSAVGSIIKKIDMLSLNVSPEEFRILATHVNTVYVKMMKDHRDTLGNVFDLPFPEFFNAHTEAHGKTAFGFLFEDMLIHQNNWEKLSKINNPGDARNHKGQYIEIKYASVVHAEYGIKKILWNHITENTKAQHFLLYAHDYRGDGNVYSFYLTKRQALKMRRNNENNQIAASVSSRTNTQWAKLQEYCIGISDRPIVPKHLTSPANFDRLSA
jgi:hypothetical protein